MIFPKRLSRLATIVAAILMSGFTPTANAQDEAGRDEGIVQTSGAITVLAEPPPSVELFALESDDTLFVFAERKGHVLSRDLTVNLSRPGDYFPETTPASERSWEALGPGIIAKGTRVDSYYFHFDNETYNENFSVRRYFGCEGQYGVSGSITFERPILGVVMRAGLGRRAHLRQADEELGLAEVDYDQHYLRHFPGVNIADGCGSDRFILSEDRRTLTVTNFTDVHHDNYRVIVAAD